MKRRGTRFCLLSWYVKRPREEVKQVVGTDVSEEIAVIGRSWSPSCSDLDKLIRPAAMRSVRFRRIVFLRNATKRKQILTTKY